ncbi:MAG TPA: FCD domain-containing protein [Spirochaetales bacterium]|nr:FCD domain-containing protein [Spirochaetales bacterium]HRY55268.1 FCD domain-containing protein [Spirochaetia bacterium]HRZ66084.1 FCD domain-containing protein [Spirochaetia bacterium]
MRPNLDDRDRIVLECIRDADGPMGSWSLVEQLEAKGEKVSSASIGRILYRLEQLGYVEGQGNKGRILTKTGLKAIARAKAYDSMDRHRKDLEKLINSKVLEDFVMVLQARKAIERETARLAAENMTEAGKQSLIAILEEQEAKAARGESIADVDIAFHREIAMASRNSALLSLYGILAMMGQQSELFEVVRSRVDSPYRKAHRDILEALCRHDPDGAVACIERHMDSLIEDVTKYWDRVKE